MKLEIRHLRLLQAIAEERSVRRAADRLNLSQPALSRQLLGIEERLGAPLFLRLKKKMVLTPGGEALLSTARNVIEQLKGAEETFEGLASGTRGLVRISTECNTCYHWLPSRITRFHGAFPDVEVRLVVEATPQPMTYLLDGKLDVAICSSQVRDARCESAPLFDDDMVAVLATGHRLARKRTIAPADFAEENLLLYNMPKAANRIYREFLQPAGVEPRQTTQVQLTEAIFELVKAGLGVAVLASWAVKTQAAANEIAARPLAPRLHRHWTAVRLKGKPAPPYITAFVDALREAPFSERLGQSARTKR
jgi:LysR family transcriptional regulator, regulator for metE and metH